MTTNKSDAVILQQVQTCPAIGYQPATVCVPVRVTPFANALPTTTFCCGMPVVTPGATICTGVVNGSCTFTITQNICMAIPVEFGANAAVGRPAVLCGVATSEDVCTDCGIIIPPENS